MTRYVCHEILHSGDGPRRNRREVTARNPEEAARAMANSLWEKERQRQGVEYGPEDNGDYQWIAVEFPNNEGHYKVFKVVLRVTLQTEIEPLSVGSFTAEQIDGMKIHKETKFTYS